MLAAGADGCRKGWICITRDLDSSKIASGCFSSARELICQEPAPDILTIDIPIGLLDAGARHCDREARRELRWPRASSVFTAPLRPMLTAKSWVQACEIRQRIEGKRVAKQAWAIMGKVREVDELMRTCLNARDRVHEVHPEVCLWAWNGRRTMLHPKRSRDGKAERRVLVDGHFGVEAFSEVRGLYPKKDVGDDDIVDAFAALWTAERIVRGAARRLPDVPPMDGLGLPMEIVY